MKNALFFLLSIFILNTYAQNQVSVLTDWGIKSGKLDFYKQSSIGILYRHKQNTFALKYDIIDIKFRNFWFDQLYNVIGGTGSYYRHFNKKKLSGFYGGLSASYLQYSSSYSGNRKRYNAPHEQVFYNLYLGPQCLNTRYRQLSIVPTLGYECYALKHLSLFAELGYGVLFLNSKCTKWNYYYDGPSASTASNKTAGNFNFNIGIKAVIWRKAKSKE